jgi:hypothetical protein
MSPAHPPVKCFFFFSKDMNVYSSYGRIFEAEFALKSRGFGDFGSPSGQDKSVKANPTLPVDSRIHSARRARKHCLKQRRWL